MSDAEKPAGAQRSPHTSPALRLDRGDHAHSRGDGSGDPTANDPAEDGVRHEGAAATHAADPNLLLRALPLADYTWLLPQLAPTRLRLKQVLIEVGTVGNEGLIGLPLVFEDDTMPNRVFVQVEGDAWRIGADAFRRMLDARPAVRKLCLRYALAIGGLQPAAHARGARGPLAPHDARPGARSRLRAHTRVPLADARRAARRGERCDGHAAERGGGPLRARARDGARPREAGGGVVHVLPDHPDHPDRAHPASRLREAPNQRFRYSLIRNTLPCSTTTDRGYPWCSGLGRGG